MKVLEIRPEPCESHLIQTPADPPLVVCSLKFKLQFVSVQSRAGRREERGGGGGGGGGVRSVLQHGHGHTLIPAGSTCPVSGQDRYRQYSLKSDLTSCCSKMSPFLFQGCLCRLARRGARAHTHTLHAVESGPVVTPDTHHWSPVKSCLKQKLIPFNRQPPRFLSGSLLIPTQIKGPPEIMDYLCNWLTSKKK